MIACLHTRKSIAGLPTLHGAHWGPAVSCWQSRAPPGQENRLLLRVLSIYRHRWSAFELEASRSNATGTRCRATLLVV